MEVMLVRTDELYHHGIKGQKWGIRRFQNPDGSYTAAGKARERKQNDRQARRDIKRDRKYAEKNVSLLSDEELNARINRLQRERTLKELSSQQLRPGRHKAAQLLDRYGTQALGAIVGIGVSATVGKYINENVDRAMAKQGYYSKRYNPDGTVRNNNNGGGKKGGNVNVNINDVTPTNSGTKKSNKKGNKKGGKKHS